MIKGITVGVFDIFHLGHLRMLKNAKKNCDYLTVAVHDDVLNIKKVNFLYTLQERMEIVKSIKYVDEVISYERVDELLKNIDFDIFLYGPDQNHEFFQRALDFCKNNAKKHKVIPRTKGISSTQLRDMIEKTDIVYSYERV
jgi:glycerol-3-phosphate cytidylyltransferase